MAAGIDGVGGAQQGVISTQLARVQNDKPTASEAPKTTDSAPPTPPAPEQDNAQAPEAVAKQDAPPPPPPPPPSDSGRGQNVDRVA